MTALTERAGTAQTYLAGLGATGALIAGVVSAFLLVVGMVTFDAWPRAATLFGPRAEVEAVGSGEAASPAAKLPRVDPLAGRGGAASAPRTVGGGTDDTARAPGGGGGGDRGAGTGPGPGPGGGGGQAPAGSTPTTGGGSGATGAGATGGNTLQQTVNDLGETVNNTVSGLGQTVNDTVTGLGQAVDGTLDGVNRILNGLTNTGS